MDVRPTGLPGVMVITPARHTDARGSVVEVWNQDALARQGLGLPMVHAVQSHSARPWTLRGLHAQAPPHAQAKLVRCLRGRSRHVAVDIRAGSATFGRWIAQDLTADQGRQVFVPAGFLHGFLTLEPDTEVLYLCSAPYEPAAQWAVRHDDPDIGINWGLQDVVPILSARDAAAPPLRDLAPPGGGA